MSDMWVWATGNDVPLYDDYTLRPFTPVRAEKYEGPDGQAVLLVDSVRGDREFEVDASLLEPAPDWAVEMRNMRVRTRIHKQDDGTPRIHQLQPNWSADMWLDLMSRYQGQYPCGSSMRNLVFNARAEDGWFEAADWVELVGALQDHGWYEELENVKDEEPGLLDSLTDTEENPWLQVVRSWPLVKGRLATKPIEDAEEVTDLEGAIATLNNGVRFLDMTWLYMPDYGYGDPENFPSMATEERKRRHKLNVYDRGLSMATLMLRIVPALHTLYHKLPDLYPDPIEGLAAVLVEREQWVVETDPDTGEKREELRQVLSTDPWGHGILMLRAGLAIFPDQEALDETIDLWESTDPDIRDRIKVVPVTVSVQDGIVLRD